MMECPCGENVEGTFLVYLQHLLSQHTGHDSSLHEVFGTCETCELYRELGNLPVTCPSQHPVGRQNPLYEGTTATGWFRCEVCLLEYRPLPEGSETCDMDGHTEDTFGGEHYWHCEEEAVYLVRMPENHPEGVISGTTEMRLCTEHLEEVIFE